MGQRLIVDININRCNDGINEVSYRLCSVYYHWSAYTTDSVKESLDLMGFLQSDQINFDEMSDDEIILALIRHLEKNGGGVARSDIDYIKERFKPLTFSNSGSRNNGILICSEDAMLDICTYTDAVIDIYPQEDIVDNCVWWVYEDLESIDDEKDPNSLKIYELDFSPDFYNYENGKRLYDILMHETFDLIKYNDHYYQKAE